MIEGEITTDERSTPVATLEAAPAHSGGLLVLMRRFVGRRGHVIEAGAKTIALAEPRPRAPLYGVTFVLFVVIPSLATAIYFAFFASDQYVAEARFAVRTAQVESLSDKVKSALSAVTMTVSLPAMSGQDAYIIATYIRSRAILDDLNRTLDLKTIFRRPEADVLARLKNNASPEELLGYWQHMASVYIDGPSGVVTVSVRAFRPDDALRLTRAVLDASENLANSVSARAHADAMRRTEAEVRTSEARVLAALADLRAFRDQTGMINPISQANSTGVLLIGAMTEQIRLQNDLFVAQRAMSENAPTTQTAKMRLEELDRQIADLKTKLTSESGGTKTVSGVLGKFEQLELNRVFAEKLYEMARDSLERARARAETQNIYISVFVPPVLPEEAEFPQRLSFSLLTPIGLAILWGIFALIGAAVEDHRV